MTLPGHSPPSAARAVESFSSGVVAGHYSHDGYTIVWAQGGDRRRHGEWPDAGAANAVHAQQCRVIVDLTDVTFMDSSGLNVLVLARRKAEAGRGELRLFGACRMVRNVLHMTGLDQVFPVHSTIEESIGLGSAVHARTFESVPGRLEQLDEVPGRIRQQDLASTGAGHDVADEGQPAARRSSTSESKSSRTRWMRFLPAAAFSSGVDRAPELVGPESRSRSGPRTTSANADPALKRTVNPRWVV